MQERMRSDEDELVEEDTAEGNAAIELQGVRKVYGSTSGGPEKVALEGVDLTIPRGSIFGLLGPNGAGKSTLINILAGLVIKTSGSVKIWGFDQDSNPRMSRASIGVVPQELNIDPFLTPLQSLDIQAGLYGVRRAERRSAELLEALGLADKADAYSRTLSGGMRRRLLVAKAMVHSPPVLVLDEPTAGVDIELRRQLWDYVGELNRAGVTVVLTTHYLEEAEAMCDRIAILHRGRVVTEAPTADLIGAIDRKTLVIRPSGALPGLERVTASLPKGASASLRTDGALGVAYRRSAGDVGAILASLQAAGVSIADLSVEEADLEDVFLEMTTDSGAGAT